jgi:hypothetical protein
MATTRTHTIQEQQDSDEGSGVSGRPKMRVVFRPTFDSSRVRPGMLLVLIFLNIGVDHIMNNLEAGLSFANYTNLYTCVYDYCTSTKMQNNKTDGNRSKIPSYSFFL